MERILVVEDDLALSAGLCFELDSAGYASVPAYNCAKARYLLADRGLSLALLDVNLPDGSGFDMGAEDYGPSPSAYRFCCGGWRWPCAGGTAGRNLRQTAGRTATWCWTSPP